MIGFYTNDKSIDDIKNIFLLSDRHEIQVIAFGKHDIRFVNKVLGLHYDDTEVNQFFYTNNNVASIP